MNKAHEERENANKEFEKMLEKYDRWVIRTQVKKRKEISPLYIRVFVDGQSAERGVSAAESNRGDGGGQR